MYTTYNTYSTCVSKNTAALPDIQTAKVTYTLEHKKMTELKKKVQGAGHEK